MNPENKTLQINPQILWMNITLYKQKPKKTPWNQSGQKPAYNQEDYLEKSLEFSPLLQIAAYLHHRGKLDKAVNP